MNKINIKPRRNSYTQNLFSEMTLVAREYTASLFQVINYDENKLLFYHQTDAC